VFGNTGLWAGSVLVGCGEVRSMPLYRQCQ